MSGLALALFVSGAIVIRGALNGLNPIEAFQDIFAVATGDEARRITGGGFRSQRSTTGPGLGSPVVYGDAPKFTPNVERWRGLVEAHFPAQYVNQALSVMQCESGGNPTATNSTSSASGLFQHLPKYWAQRSLAAGVAGSSIYDPIANVTVAGWLFGQSNTWSHWSCKPTVS